MLTILSAFAQEESKSASDNQKWRIRTAYEQGEIMCWRFLFGYKITKDKVEIDPVEGPIAKEVFERVARFQCVLCLPFLPSLLYVIFLGIGRMEKHVRLDMDWCCK